MPWDWLRTHLPGYLEALPAASDSLPSSARLPLVLPAPFPGGALGAVMLPPSSSG
jgi:hypothetical protein